MSCCRPFGRPPSPLKVNSIFAATLLIGGVVHGDEITEQDLISDIPMAVSATRLLQPVNEAPVSITVIDRQLIEASGAVEIYDVLRLVPGMQIGLTWRNHYTAFTYHGQSDGLSRRMQVLIDGRVALSSQFGLTDWDRLGITVDDIERIEVVRGSSVASYGSHAYMAAINIITRDVALSPTWHLTTAVGSNDLQLTSVRYKYHGENLDYQLALGRFETDGFDGVNDEVNAPFARMKGNYQLDGTNSVDWQLGYGGGEGGRGGSEQGFPLIEPVGQIGWRGKYAVVRWNQTPSADKQSYLQFSYNQSISEDRTPHGQLVDFFPQGLPAGLENEPVWSGALDVRADRTDLEYQQTLELNSDNRVVWGAGARQSRMKSYLTLQGDGYFTDRSARLFANWERRAGRWLLNGGAMLEHGDVLTTKTSYRLGANYRLHDRHTLRVSYAQGARQSFVAETYHEVGLKTESGRLLDAIVVSPQVPEPEEITSYEVGLISEFNPVTVDLKLFRERLSNEIIETVDPAYPELLSLLTPGAIVRTNDGNTTITGAEIGLDAKLWDDSRLWVAYSYASADQQSPPNAIRASQPLSATPRHTASLSLSQQLGENWAASVNYYYLSKMNWAFWGEPLDSYDRVDMRLAKDFQLGGAKARLELIGQNLGGSSYNEFSLRNTFDRRAFVRFSLQLD